LRQNILVPNRTQLGAHLALLAVALIYGLNYSVAKDVMPTYLLPRGFILLRVLGAVVLFHLLAIVYPKQAVQKKDWGRLALAGFFGVAANQLLFFEGLNLTTPINASVIMTTNPLIVMLLSALVVKVPVRPVQIVGISLGLLGAVLLITRGGSQLTGVLSGGKTLGNLLVFLNAASYGAYLIVVKPLMHSYRPIIVIKWVFTLGLAFVLPFGLPQLLDFNPATLPLKIILEIAFVVLATTFLAYLLNIYALKTLSSTTVSYYIYLQPIFATAAAIGLGKDELSTLAVAAAAFIFSGVYLVSFYQR
jgi:drug/metabolite transporter (DMT)-like permease